MGSKRRYYLVAIVMTVVATLLNYITPLIIKVTVDFIIPLSVDRGTVFFDFFLDKQDLAWLRENLWLCGVVLVVVTGLEGISNYYKQWNTARACEGMTQNLRNELYNHINHLPYLHITDIQTGDLMQRCTSDTETIKTFMESQLMELFRIFIMLIVAIPIMLFIDVRMTVISLIIIPFIIGFSLLFFLKIRVLFKESTEAEAAMSVVVQENLTGIRVVKAFSRERFEEEKFDEANRKFRDTTLRLINYISLYWSTSAFVCRLQIGVVLVIGVIWVGKEQISTGDLIVFLTYVTTMIWPIRMLGRVMAEMGKAFVSIQRVETILNSELETERDGCGVLAGKRIRGEIDFRGVGFAYQDGNRVLRDISFHVPAGSTVAIIGPTGAGKSTLVHLLPRLIDYQEGTITIDGVELNSMDRKWIRKNIGIVLQEPFLFSKTVGDNIVLGAGDAEEERIVEAARVACIHDTIINSFDAGYDTMIGERGVTLSGGQKQRIAIAQAILRDAPILVFDDSLSAVDSETDMRIQAQLDKRRGRATTFIISHRTSTISGADLIVVLEDGMVSQCGKHEQLLRECGLYQDIFNIQNLLHEDIKREEDR